MRRHRCFGLAPWVFFLLVFFANCLAASAGTSYVVRAVLPLSDTTNPAYAQWRSVMQLAADEATTAWGSDSLVIEFIDAGVSDSTALNVALRAGGNSSVLALLGSGIETLTDAVMLAADYYGMAFVSMSGASPDEYTDPLPYFSLTSDIDFGPAAFKAYSEYFGWTDSVALLYEQNDNGVRLRDVLMSTTNISMIPLSLDPSVPTYWPIFNDIIAQSHQVIWVVADDPSIFRGLIELAEEKQFLTKGSTWIYYNQGPTLNFTLPQGVISMDQPEASVENRTLFLQKLQALDPNVYPLTGPNAVLEPGTIYSYEAVHALALVIGELRATSSVTRANIITGLSNLNTYGVVGPLKFGDEGNRHAGVAEWLVSDGSQMNLCAVYTGDQVNQLQPIVWPGGTTAVPDSDLVRMPLVMMGSLSYNLAIPGLTENMTNLYNYAATRINDQPNWPSSFGYIVPYTWDDQGDAATAVNLAFNATAMNAVAVIGGTSSGQSELIQDVLLASGIPQISQGGNSDDLANKKVYPTFTRVVASATDSANAFLALSRFYGWDKVTIISVDSGINTAILTLLLEADIEILYQLDIDPTLNNFDDAIAPLNASEVRVLFLLVDSDNISNLAASLYRSNINPLAVVVSDCFVFYNLSHYIQQAGLDTTFFDGWVVIGEPDGQGPVYDAFVSEVANLDPVLWPGVTQLSLGSPLTLKAYEAAMVVGDAVVRAVAANQDPTEQRALLSFILATNITGLTGQIWFDKHGNRPGSFTVRNVRGGYQYSIGTWNNHSGFIANGTAIWPDGTTNIPQDDAPPTLKWLQWDSGAGIAFAIISALGMAIGLVFCGFVYHQRASQVIMASTWQFLIVILLGCVVGLGSVYTWIGMPRPWICGLRLWLASLSFLIVIAPVAVKTWRLYRIFSLQNYRILAIPLRTLSIMLALLVAVQVVICIFWISMGTVQPTLVFDINDPTIAYVVCGANSANHISAYVTYAYIGVILLASSYLAFRVRKLPKDFNEARWIAITVYNILIFTVLTLILCYALSATPVTIMILICVDSFVICYGTIGIMILPKLWDLLMHPEKRSSSSSGMGNSTGTKKGTTTNSGTRPSSVTRSGDRSRGNKSPKIAQSGSGKSGHSSKSSKESYEL